jgi:hypothetical protein
MSRNYFFIVNIWTVVVIWTKVCLLLAYRCVCGSMELDLSEQLSKPKAVAPPPSVNIPIIAKPRTARAGQKTRVKDVYVPPSQVIYGFITSVPTFFHTLNGIPNAWLNRSNGFHLGLSALLIM